MIKHPTMRRFFLLVFYCASFLAANGSEPVDYSPFTRTNVPGMTGVATDSLNPPPDCDPTRRPVIMVHGFLASGDTWAKFYQLFHTNGYCPDRLFVFDWNTLSQTADHSSALDAFIDTIRARTGADQVDLMGHSAGGALGYSYLSYFLYDGNSNKQSDGSPVGMFNNFPFLNGVDMFFDPASTMPITVFFNGRMLRVRKIPSNEGVEVVVFD